MNRIFYLLLVIISFFSFSCKKKIQITPVSLHPSNPHYFLFRGKPIILIGSTEHYGALMNLDFDYLVYLDTLKKYGFNITRVFSGIYCENSHSFGITKNTMAPDSNKFIAPWARSDQPGYQSGGNKFDLSKWDESYFVRLKDFVSKASQRGIIVELVFFCEFYDFDESMWKLSPLNPVNNINNMPKIPMDDVLNLKYPVYTKVEEDMVKKIIIELNPFDNVIYEICNEPYNRVTSEFQSQISAVICEVESNFNFKHLIAQNVGNISSVIHKPDTNISVFNFHYANPQASLLNYHLNKPICDDETGFKGPFEMPYRQEAWNFFMAGGSGFEHLDYSFTTDHEDGTFVIPETQPGWGGQTLRKQFIILKKFIEGFNFLKLKPDTEVITGISDSIFDARILSNKGIEYAIYISPEHKQTPENISIRWTGNIIPKFSEDYTFTTISDDGIRLWVNDKLIIDNWTDHGSKADFSKPVKLIANEKVKIKAEYYNGMPGAVLILKWESKNQVNEVIPIEAFSSNDKTEKRLKCEYFSDRFLKKINKSGYTSKIFFNGSLNELFDKQTDTTSIALKLFLPPGTYQVSWLNTITGISENVAEIKTLSDTLTLQSPSFKDDIALKIKKK